MGKKKKSENEPNIEEKIIPEVKEQDKKEEPVAEEKTEKEELPKEEFDEFEGLTDAEKLLLAKEERFLDKEEEEEVEEELDDSAWGNFKRKIGFFLDYYKWFVIIPAIIIVITVIMITSYLNESRERALELTITNAQYEIPDLMYAVENDFIAYTGENITGDDIRIVYDIRYPDTSTGAENFTQADNVSMQKFNASVISGRVDIALTESWVVNDYSVTDSTLDLREIFDEDFLKDHEDKVYYARDSSGEKIPVAFYIDAKVVKDVYPEDAEPLAVSFDTSKHKEEARRFMEWLLSESE
ncbi:MAG: hypothetical protein IKS56_01850 [Lachnospiraceae bacterium]|nr:hypothetical protein [Lachnospiraceae bacterium]